MGYNEFLGWAAFFEEREREREKGRKGSGGRRKKG